jgi:hypothetical protein
MRTSTRAMGAAPDQATPRITMSPGQDHWFSSGAWQRAGPSPHGWVDAQPAEGLRQSLWANPGDNRVVAQGVLGSTLAAAS